MFFTNIGMFIDGSRFSSSIENFSLVSNPGIGGSEYMYLCLAAIISKRCDSQLTLFTTKKIPFKESNINQIIVNDLNDSIKYFDTEVKNGLFIISPKDDECICFSSQIKNTFFISWEHSFFSKTIISQISNNERFIANIVLTKNVKKRLAFNKKIFQKTGVINNFTHLDSLKRDCDLKNNFIVSYVGAIFPIKGLDILTEVWPKILKKVPGAKLYVYGSSRLYFKDYSNGHFDIASEDYEKQILYPLLKNNILDSVIFKGAIPNNQLYEEIKNSKVGVAGVRGDSETFCISAIDFGSLGIPVVTHNSNGLIDTNPKGCGFRYRTRNQLIKYIVRLLKDDALNQKMGCNYYCYVHDSFSFSQFENNWNNLLNVVTNKSLINSSPSIKTKISIIFRRITISPYARYIRIYEAIRRRIIRKSKVIREKY